VSRSILRTGDGVFKGTFAVRLWARAALRYMESTIHSVACLGGTRNSAKSVFRSPTALAALRRSLLGKTSPKFVPYLPTIVASDAPTSDDALTGVADDARTADDDADTFGPPIFAFPPLATFERPETCVSGFSVATPLSDIVCCTCALDGLDRLAGVPGRDLELCRISLDRDPAEVRKAIRSRYSMGVSFSHRGVPQSMQAKASAFSLTRVHSLHDHSGQSDFDQSSGANSAFKHSTSTVLTSGPPSSSANRTILERRCKVSSSIEGVLDRVGLGGCTA